MINRYYWQAIFNGAIFGLTGLGTLPYIGHKNEVGNFIIVLVCFYVSASLFIFKDKFRDAPPEIEQVRSMTRELWKRLFTP